jgi:hypothetical protein
MPVLPNSAFFVRIFALNLTFMNEAETKNQELNPDSKSEQKKLTHSKIISFSLEFGFMIVLPLVIFVSLGKLLSAHYHNQGFLYGGVVLALITSVLWFWKRITDIYKDFIN